MIELRNLTRKRVNYGLYRRIFRKIFKNKSFELSVVFASPALMKKLNIQYRKKHKSANVLSFLIAPRIGEIFLNAQERDLPHLFVHGCLHLLGYDHKNDKDATYMERLERKLLYSQF